MKAHSPKTERFSLRIGWLMFQSRSWLKILVWTTICKPLITFPLQSYISSPVGLDYTLFFTRHHNVITRNSSPGKYQRGYGSTQQYTTTVYVCIFESSPRKKLGGTVKVVDSRSFSVANKIAAAEVEIEVGGIR